MIKYILTIIFFLSNVYFSQEISDKEKAHNNVLEAIKLIDNGDLDNAILLLNETIKLDPQNPIYSYELGYAHYLKKNYKKSIEILEGTLEKDNINDQYFQMLGNVYDLNGQRDKAIKTYKKGLERFPDSGRLYLELGNTNRDNINKALEFYETGIEVDPKFPSNYYWASKNYCNSTEEVWGILYGEIFMNIERGSKRTEEISKLLFDIYLNEIKFSNDSTVSVSFCKNEQLSFDGLKMKLPFGTLVFETTLLLSVLSEETISISSLIRIRKRFIENYFKKGFNKTHPNILFDWHKILIENNKFEPYNYWLFMQGSSPEFEEWIIKNKQKFDDFIDWFKANQIVIDNNNKFVRSDY